MAETYEHTASSSMPIGEILPWFTLGAITGIAVLAVYRFLVDARAEGRRRMVVARHRSSRGETEYRLQAQKDLGLAHGIAMKLLYEYRVLGSNTCCTRAMQRIVLWKFNKFCEPCKPSDVKAFADKFGIDLQGWGREMSEYQSIDDFFTRKYAELNFSRDDAAVCSPSEGTCMGYTSVSGMKKLWVKNKHCTLKTMGIPPKYVSQLEGGIVCLLKLDVNNLHRFYAPVSGRILARIDHLEPLRLSHSIRPVALQNGWSILTENRRVILIIDWVGVGPVAMMIVGGIAIDSIEMRVSKGDQISQGDELGMFHMGGSAILLALPRSRAKGKVLALERDIATASQCQFEFACSVGDTLARISE